MKVVLVNLRHTFAVLLFFTSLSAYSQKYVHGDSTVVKGIREVLSGLYGKNDTTIYFITKHQFQKVSTAASEITVEKKKGIITRIAINSATTQGYLAEEYWLDNNQLIFVYQTFGYYRELNPVTKEVNFKGQRYWEARYYFQNERVKYEAATGTREKALTYTEVDLISQKNKLLEYIKN